MSTIATQHGNVSVLDQVKGLDPEQFGTWAEGLVSSGMEVLQVINKQLREGRINTLQAAGIMACTYGQLFDYQTFHNPNALALLLSNQGQQEIPSRSSH